MTGRLTDGRSADRIVQQKYSPLELQVLELKKEHPGVILIFEVSSLRLSTCWKAHSNTFEAGLRALPQVGYKFRFFGEDAEVASSLCNIFCYPARNFMSATIPVARLHVYVRRLVAAGHKVRFDLATQVATMSELLTCLMDGLRLAGLSFMRL